MILLAPALLLGLLALPAIWWLVRATPPAPQERSFPSLMLLQRLTARREDAARAPLWLLILRVAAVALIITGLVRPVLTSRTDTADSRPLIIVLDDGWAASEHWAERLAAVQSLAQSALRHGATVTLLHAARSADGAMPAPFVTRDAQALAGRIARLRPQPWPTDRAALAALMQTLPDLGSSRVLLVSDALATRNDSALKAALTKARSVQDLRWNRCYILLLHAGTRSDGTLHARLESPDCAKRSATLRAVGRNGGTLATFPLVSGQDQALTLPALLRNQLDHLTLEGHSGPATTFLMGEADQRRPVGLLQTPGDTTPLIGSAFFLDRALGPLAELHSGDASALLATPLSVLIATDGALSGEQTRATVLAWVRHGGMLIRFAGPGLAAGQDPTTSPTGPDPLLPVTLMNGMRQLGGPMSWGAPQKLAPFPDHSPFAGLALPSEVTVSRQVLARPETGLDDRVWAALSDGTPLVTVRSEGNGTVVLFHVTASPDWSNLPLSGLFPQMLERLIDRSAGVAGASPSELAPWRMLSSDGALVMPPPAARVVAADSLSRTLVNVTHPAGLYGPAHATHALNLGTALPPLAQEPVMGTPLSPDHTQTDFPLAPILLALGLLLLMLDLLLSLRRRGLLGPLAVTLILGLTLSSAQAEPSAAPTPPPDAPSASIPADHVPQAALETRLAYVITGHDDVDLASREGLQGLSDYVTARSSATLGKPDGVIPGKDDLAFYPLLYWPITADAQPDPARTKALNAYMDHGGIILIDEQGAGSDDGNGASMRAALRRVTDGLTIPPLARLTDTHVLAHTFYLLHGFQGRIANQPVYVARNGDESNDDVSPVIIGSSDWAHAWAVDSSGTRPFACIPGGEEQRTQAYRFGMNMVLYALTGNYKSDQAHYPEMLRRLGKSDDAAPHAPTPDESEEDAP